MSVNIKGLQIDFSLCSHHYIPSSLGKDTDDTEVKRCAEETSKHISYSFIPRYKKLGISTDWNVQGSTVSSQTQVRTCRTIKAIYKGCSAYGVLSLLNPLLMFPGIRDSEPGDCQLLWQGLGHYGRNLFRCEEGPHWGLFTRDISPGVILEFGFWLFILGIITK